MLTFSPERFPSHGSHCLIRFLSNDSPQEIYFIAAIVSWGIGKSGADQVYDGSHSLHHILISENVKLVDSTITIYTPGKYTQYFNTYFKTITIFQTLQCVPSMFAWFIRNRFLISLTFFVLFGPCLFVCLFLDLKPQLPEVSADCSELWFLCFQINF